MNRYMREICQEISAACGYRQVFPYVEITLPIHKRKMSNEGQYLPDGIKTTHRKFISDQRSHKPLVFGISFPGFEALDMEGLMKIAGRVSPSIQGLPATSQSSTAKATTIWLVCLSIFAMFAMTGIRIDAQDSVYSEKRTVTQIGNGIFVIRHKDSPDGNLNGNTTVIIGEREVFVVDSCFQVSAALEDIAQIKQWTGKPVRYLLITHWHNDHNMGNGAYFQAFPGLEIVAHDDTRRDMYRTPNTAGRFVYQISVLVERLATGKGADGNPMSDKEIASTKKRLDGKRQILEELKHFVYQAPNVTFDREMDVDLGGREIRVIHPGRGTTSGDAVVYLPAEKILVAGDLVTHPVLFTYDGFPTDWITTLDSLAALDIKTIVPGHGAILDGKAYLLLCREFLQSAVDQVFARLRELTKTIEKPSVADVAKGVDLSSFRPRFVGHSPDSLDDFDQAAAALVKVVYNESTHNSRP